MRVRGTVRDPSLARWGGAAPLAPRGRVRVEIRRLPRPRGRGNHRAASVAGEFERLLRKKHLPPHGTGTLPAVRGAPLAPPDLEERPRGRGLLFLLSRLRRGVLLSRFYSLRRRGGLRPFPLRLRLRAEVLHVLEEHPERLVQPPREGIEKPLELRGVVHPRPHAPHERLGQRPALADRLGVDPRALKPLVAAERLEQNRARRRRVVPRALNRRRRVRRVRPRANRGGATRHSLVDRDDPREGERSIRSRSVRSGSGSGSVVCSGSGVGRKGGSAVEEEVPRVSAPPHPRARQSIRVPEERVQDEDPTQRVRDRGGDARVRERVPERRARRLRDVFE